MSGPHVLVVGGPGLTRALVRACRGARIRVSGPFAPSIAAAAELSPDVVVVDIDGPGGLAPLAETGALLPAARRLAVTEAVDPSSDADVIALGASGFLPTLSDPLAILQAIKRAAAGEMVIEAPRLSALVQELGDRRAPGADPLTTLTPREREVLRLVAEGGSTVDVAMALGISPATVQSHVKSVLAKLGVHSKVEAVRLAWRGGVAILPAGV